jgi:thymidylate synthase (FAD)
MPDYPLMLPARVQLAASTQYHPIDIGGGNLYEVLDTDDGGSAIAEVAGRACYQSWTKPNPRTATNKGYLAHILEVGHESVLEHGSASFYITGIGRATTHELIRHRHLSYSQLSQRFVDESGSQAIVPPLIAEASGAGGYLDILEEFADTTTAVQGKYQYIAERLLAYLDEHYPDLSPTARRKEARQAARSVLPNAIETRIMVTGNYRAWRGFLKLRATEHADAEIRRVAMLILADLQELAPNVFGDFRVSADGTASTEVGA